MLNESMEATPSPWSLHLHLAIDQTRMARFAYRSESTRARADSLTLGLRILCTRQQKH
jgi:hypothetical protein